MAFDKLLERESKMVASLSVEANGTTEVNAINIPAGSEVRDVWAVNALAGTGAANVTIGDEDDPNGWVLAADHTDAVGTVIGKATSELGVYAITQVATTPAVGEPVPPKYYATENNIIIVLSGAGTIQSKWDVYATLTPVPITNP